MARGQRKPIEQKIAEKEEIIEALQVRMKSELNELDALYNEKKLKDLEVIDDILRNSQISPDEAVEVLQDYANSRVAETA